MAGLLNMNFSHIENLANPRSNESDAIPYEYFQQWYFNFDDDNIKLFIKMQQQNFTLITR